MRKFDLACICEISIMEWVDKFGEVQEDYYEHDNGWLKLVGYNRGNNQYSNNKTT
jgi:hypothetical protein